MQSVQSSTGRIEDATFCIHDASSIPLSSNPSEQDVADEVNTWLATLWRATMNTSLTLQKVVAYRLGVGTPAPTAEHINGSAGTGWTNGDSLPWGLCARVSLYTDHPGPSGRGRFHFPSPTTNTYIGSADSWASTGAYWTAMQAVMTALNAGHDWSVGLDAHHLSLRVWSRKNNTSYDVTRYLLRPQYSYVRKRVTVP